MSELDLLRSLGDQVVPPPFERCARPRAAAPDVRRCRVPWPPQRLVARRRVDRSCLRHEDGARRTRRPARRGRHDPPADVRRRAPTIHYGDRTVDAPGAVVELDVTDDGVVARTDDGGIWFTDGTGLEQVGHAG